MASAPMSSAPVNSVALDSDEGAGLWACALALASSSCIMAAKVVGRPGAGATWGEAATLGSTLRLQGVAGVSLVHAWAATWTAGSEVAEGEGAGACTTSSRDHRALDTACYPKWINVYEHIKGIRMKTNSWHIRWPCSCARGQSARRHWCWCSCLWRWSRQARTCT